MGPRHGETGTLLAHYQLVELELKIRTRDFGKYINKLD